MFFEYLTMNTKLEGKMNINDLLILVKFIPEKYLESFIDGKLRMNSPEYFQRYHEIGIGDHNDSSIVVSRGKGYIIFDESNCIEMSSKEMSFNTAFTKYPIFCLFAIDKSIANVQEIDSGYDIKLNLSCEDKKRVQNDFNGDDYKVVIIIDTELFINKIRSEVNKRFVKDDILIHKKVRHYKEDSNVSVFDPLFYKKETFSHQHEYRFILSNDKLNIPYILDIGSIKNIVKIVSLNDFLGSEFVIKLKKAGNTSIV